MREEMKLGRIRRFRFLEASPKQLLQAFHPEWCSSSPRLGMGRRWITCKVPALLTLVFPLPSAAGSQTGELSASQTPPQGQDASGKPHPAEGSDGAQGILRMGREADFTCIS